MITTTTLEASTKNFLSKVDRKLATFDPLGKTIKQPIEKKIPNLQVTGFIKQWSDILLEKDGLIGSHNQDYRFLQLQNLAELEIDYNIFQGFDFKGIAHVLYDGAYDWQKTDGMNSNSSLDSADLYSSSERVLREFYLSYRKPWFDIKLGKQQVAWGKMDGQFIDVVNAMDRRESVQLESDDYELRRLPTWMINSTFYLGETSIQLLYLFDFEHDRFSTTNSPWSSPLLSSTSTDSVLHTKRPSAGNFSDHEYGVRIDRTAGALTYGFVYMYAWDKTPVNRINSVNLLGPTANLEFIAKHERIHHVGFTADYATTFQNVPIVGSLPTVFRVEALYSNGVRFADASKQALARSGNFNDGTSKHDTVRAAIAFEFALPERTTFMIQPSWYQTLNHRENLGPGFGGGFGDEWSFIPVVYLTRPFAFTKDRLSMDLTLYPLISGPDTDWGGMKVKLGFNFKFSNFLKGRITLNRYDGGSDTDLYGQYDNWDNVGWEISYEF